MAYLKVWLHLVWSTKNRAPLLTKKVRSLVFKHIKENAREKNIYIDRVNGFTDHVHCLISLKSDQTIAKTMQLIKGESAFWINKQKLTTERFSWQEEYFAVSVSESQLTKIRNYIDNQEQHHQKLSYQQEYEQFIDKYAF
jgi:putative transposase